MNISVRFEGYAVQFINDEWRCPHTTIVIRPPCCQAGNGITECDCQGMYRIDCTDCQNDDLRDYELDELINREMI